MFLNELRNALDLIGWVILLFLTRSSQDVHSVGKQQNVNAPNVTLSCMIFVFHPSMYFNCVTNFLWFWRFLNLVTPQFTWNTLCYKHFCCTMLVWNSVRYTTGFFNKSNDRRMIDRFYVCFYSLFTNQPIRACFALKLTNYDFHSLKK